MNFKFTYSWCGRYTLAGNLNVHVVPKNKITLDVFEFFLSLKSIPYITYSFSMGRFYECLYVNGCLGVSFAEIVGRWCDMSAWNQDQQFTLSLE